MGRITDNRADIYQEITDQMIAMIEAGTRPWSKSWNGSTAPNIPLRSTGVPYRGMCHVAHPYVAPEARHSLWGTLPSPRGQTGAGEHQGRLPFRSRTTIRPPV